VRDPGLAAIVLAGGRARRLDGAAKPALPVGGRPMLHRVLDAVAGATARVVVGPPELPMPAGVPRTREEPPGTGPVAAVAAGLSLLAGSARRLCAGPPPTAAACPPAGRPPGLVAVLAADLPLLTPDAVARLCAALRGAADADGALYLDAAGRRQQLCGVWRTGSLAAAVDRLAGTGRLAGAAMRELLAGLAVCEVTWSGSGPPPWYDCDTEAQLRQARMWVT